VVVVEVVSEVVSAVSPGDGTPDGAGSSSLVCTLGTA
jgi:hypothetical protein